MFLSARRLLRCWVRRGILLSSQNDGNAARHPPVIRRRLCACATSPLSTVTVFFSLNFNSHGSFSLNFKILIFVLLERKNLTKRCYALTFVKLSYIKLYFILSLGKHYEEMKRDS